MSAKFIVEIDLDKVESVEDVDNILQDLADDHHAGDHIIYYYGEAVGRYFVRRDE